MGPTLQSILDRNLMWCPDAPAIIEGDRQLSWADFAVLIAAVRQGLARRGIVRGSRVIVIERNSIEQVALGYALAGLGAVIVPVNWRYGSEEIAYLLAHSRPVAAVVGKEFRATFGEALTRAPQPPLLIARNGDAPSEWERWEDLVAAGEPVAESAPHSWDDPHMILYTSGTTGRPKGAMLSHRRTILDGQAALGAFGVRPAERFLCYLPLFHTGAWDYIKQYFMVGGSVVLMADFDADELVRLIERHRCTAMFGVTLVLNQMIRCAAFATADVSSLRRVAFASYDPSDLLARVDAALRERGADVGFFQAYGLSEGGPFVTLAPRETAVELSHAAGLPFPGVTVALLDDDLAPVPAGQPGEICVRSAALMDGYFDDPEATAEAFRGGWLHTGDVGRLVDGQLYVVDRVKDMIRTAGENVYPKEVEQVIVELPGVEDCAVVPVYDETYEERVVAVIIPEPGTSLTSEAVIAHARSRLAHFKCPKEVHFVETIPKTPAGKTAKRELRARLEAAAAVDPDNEAEHV
jgi:acyl-CoA synthetase (AMP-forming)/AMP-acid ligase II